MGENVAGIVHVSPIFFCNFMGETLKPCADPRSGLQSLHAGAIWVEPALLMLVWQVFHFGDFFGLFWLAVINTAATQQQDRFNSWAWSFSMWTLLHHLHSKTVQDGLQHSYSMFCYSTVIHFHAMFFQVAWASPPSIQLLFSYVGRLSI